MAWRVDKITVPHHAQDVDSVLPGSSLVMSSSCPWYPPFYQDCAQARRSSAQAIHSHPQVCAQSTAGNFLAKLVTRAALVWTESRPGRVVAAEARGEGLPAARAVAGCAPGASPADLAGRPG